MIDSGATIEQTMHRPAKGSLAEAVQQITTTLNPLFVAEVRDEKVGLHGFLVVDTSINGHACGGLRLFDNVSLDQVKLLARGMTLKYGYNGIPQGGAKAGIIGNPEMPAEQRRTLLTRFGEILSPLLRSGFYQSGPDMSISHADIDDMMAAAGATVPRVRREKGRTSGLYTALSVMIGIEAATQSKGIALKGARVAIEGFGSVGSALASLLALKKGATIIAVSTTQGALYDPRGLDVPGLLELRQKFGNACVVEYRGAERIRNEDLLTLEVEVLSPCAGQHAITHLNAPLLRTPVLVPGANNPVTLDGERILQERDIISVPYFVANSGGVMGNRMEILSVDADYIEEFLRKKNRERILQLIELSRQSGELMMSIAERYAFARFERIQQAEAGSRLRKLAYRTGLRVVNTRLIPGAALRILAPRYFNASLGNDPPILSIAGRGAVAAESLRQ